VDFPVGRTSGPALRPDPPLLGRDADLVTLTRYWHQARSGSGGVVLLHGPAGSGKTRLAREMHDRVDRGGGLVLAGTCEPGQGVPLAPLRRAIDDHLRGVTARPAHEYLSALNRVRAAAGPTASLLRGLTLALDDTLDAPVLAEADRHQQVLVAMADFLAALAMAHGGALLSIDDVQWLDPATRRVLQHLARRLDDVPLLIQLTGRDDDRGRVPAVRADLGQARHPDLRLSPLSVDVVAELTAEVTGGLQVDLPTAASLTARSGGNTFVLLQYLDALVDAGLLEPDWGHWRLDLEAARRLVRTDGVELVLRRLDGLDADGRTVLGVAAVHGPVFDYHVIADACGQPRHRVLDVADTAIWRDLVERREDGRYAFRHDRIRDALVAQYELDELRAVHQRLADALARTGGDDPETVFALARHSVLGEPAQDPARAVLACAAAGRRALADHAPAEAVRHLDRAAELAQAHGVGLDAAFLTALATAQQRAGHFPAAARTARRGLDRSTDPLERAWLLRLVAQSNSDAWAGTEETETILAALRELNRTPVHWAPLLAVCTLCTFLLGQSIRLTRLGYGTARGRVRETYRLEFLLYAAAQRQYGIQLQSARSVLYLLRQTRPAMRLGPGPELAQFQASLAIAHFALGRASTGHRHAARALALTESVRDPSQAALLRWLDAFALHTFGLDRGEALHEVLERQRQWLEPGTQNDLLIILLWDALHRGDLHEARRLAQQRDFLIADTGQPDAEAAAGFQSSTVARAALAALHAWLGEGEQAGHHLGPRPEDARLANWERLPLYGAAIAVAYRNGDFGDPFDRAVAAFDGLNLPTRSLLPIAHGFYLYRAQGRAEQYRLAAGAERPRRLRQAKAALRLVAGMVRTPLLRAHVETTRALLAQATGRPQTALDLLAGPAAAPSIAYDAARIRALALRDLDLLPQAQEQSELAERIAQEQEWPRYRSTVDS
jgi:hypothetical protein